MPRKSKVIRHVTRGSVLDDLKVPPEMLAVFKVKAELHSAILEIASRFSQAELQALLHESQPRISDFMRGKIAKFSLETLLYYADRLKMRPQIRTTGSNNKTHLLEVFAAE